MNNSISPRVTAWHPADLKSGDSGALEITIKHCMDPKARFTPKMASGPQTIMVDYFVNIFSGVTKTFIQSIEWYQSTSLHKERTHQFSFVKCLK